MPTSWRSFAKINLHLEVLGRRADGFHELRTVFQSVSLSDRLTIELAPRDIELSVSGLAVPADRGNLAWRAAEAFLQEWGGGRSRGARIHLHKRIPVGGGLGGGSSDAATVLLALRELTGRPETVEDLETVAAELGSDVPFFLVGGTALGTGRGERVVPLPDLSEESVWLIDPGISVSTEAVFSAGAFERASGDDALIGRLERGEVPRASEALGSNDLEARVLDLYEPVEAVYTALVQRGIERVRVSGSGATMFAFAAALDERPLEVRSAPGARCIEARTLSRRSIAARRVVHSVEGP